VVLQHPLGHGARNREMAHALAQHAGVGLDEPLSKRYIALGVRKVAEPRARQLVCGTMLMHEPDNFSWMARKVRREFGGDDEIDVATPGLRDVETPPRLRARK